jgi:hypothetical protein
VYTHLDNHHHFVAYQHTQFVTHTNPHSLILCYLFTQSYFLGDQDTDLEHFCNVVPLYFMYSNTFGNAVTLVDHHRFHYSIFFSNINYFSNHESEHHTVTHALSHADSDGNDVCIRLTLRLTYNHIDADVHIHPNSHHHFVKYEHTQLVSHNYPHNLIICYTFTQLYFLVYQNPHWQRLHNTFPLCFVYADNVGKHISFIDRNE